MSDKKKSNKLHDFFVKNLVIPRNFKNSLATQNLGRLVYIDWCLFAFGTIILVLYIANQYYKDPSLKPKMLYYAGYSVFFGINVFLCYILKNKNNISAVIKNSPVYLSILSINILCLYSFFNAGNIFNSFINFASASIIVSIFFFVEPAFFDIVMICSFIAMAPKLYNQYGVSTIINMVIFISIINLLSLYKWNATIKQLQNEKSKEDYTNVLEKEITLASFVQKSFYNHGEMTLDGWSIATFSEAMAGVSGDMYDIYYTKQQLDGIGVFDVSGHGIASGLVTMLVKNIIHQEFYDGKDDSLQDVLQNINTRIINEKGEIENYLTGTLIRVNGNKVEFINAGNPHPIIYLKETDTAYFHENKDSNHYGVIGMADFPVNYNPSIIEMNPGDLILFYTDGIIENNNEKGFPYGKKNLIQALKANTFKTCNDQLNDIMTNFREFKGNARSSDDITLVMLKKL